MTDGREQAPIIIRIRAEERQRDLIDQAAEHVGRSREGFVLEAACREAADVLLDQVFFALTGPAFAEFRALRDNPPAPTDRLRQLLLTTAPLGMTFGHLSAPAPITDGHDLAPFDCGVATLNDWLKKRAVKNERSGASRTYVLCDGHEVVGYYCLATGAVDHDDAPNPLRRNMPDPIPVLVLGRLALDRRYQNRGLGRALLRDAVFRALQVAELAGVVALLVHALSEEAHRFYQSCGFVELPSQPMTLCLMMRTAHQTGIPPGHN